MYGNRQELIETVAPLSYLAFLIFFLLRLFMNQAEKMEIEANTKTHIFIQFSLFNGYKLPAPNLLSCSVLLIC